MEAASGQTADLAAGRVASRQHRWSNSWLFRTKKTKILSSSVLCTDDDSHVGWRRELSLTRFAAQHLPEAVFAGNELEILHEESGVRIRCELGGHRARGRAKRRG